MTAQTVLLEVDGHLFVWRIGFVKRPAPAVTPEGIARVSPFFIFDHDEPHFCSRCPMGIAGCHLRMFRSVDLLHQDGTVRELFVIAVVLRCTGGSVCKVHLIPFWIEDCVGSERLVLVSVVFGLRDVARLVDRKSTRLNSSHQIISYAVFCLKKKKNNNDTTTDNRLSTNTHDTANRPALV